MSDPTNEDVLTSLIQAGENSLASDWSWLGELATSEERVKIMQALADLDMAYRLKDSAEAVLKDIPNGIEDRWHESHRDTDEILA